LPLSKALSGLARFSLGMDLSLYVALASSAHGERLDRKFLHWMKAEDTALCQNPNEVEKSA
jgi:hypothetical protein